MGAKNIFFIALAIISGARINAMSLFCICFYKKPLFDASRNGDLELLKKLVSKANINTQDPLCNTPLIVAASHNHEPVISFLLKIDDININAQDHLENTALHVATEKNHEKIVSLLCKATGIDINKPNLAGETPLHIAVRAGYMSIVYHLLSCEQIDLYSEDGYGKTALDCAALTGNEAMVQLFLNLPDIDISLPDTDGNTVLHRLLLSNFLYDCNVRFLKTDRTKNKEKMVSLFLDHPTIIINLLNNDGNSILNLALDKKYLHIANLIKNKIIEVTFQAFSTLKYNNTTQFQSAINIVGVDIIDTQGDTVLHKAFGFNQVDAALKILLRAQDPRKLLTVQNKKKQFPLELLNPETPLFTLCLNLAFADQEKSPKNRAKICAQCSKQDCQMRCSKCQAIYYCSPKCQKKHWAKHKFACRLSESF